MSKFATQTDAINSKISNFAALIKEKARINSHAVDVGVPFLTGRSMLGKEIWAAMIYLGPLPNSSIKSVIIPQLVRDEWGPAGDHWIDGGNSYAYDAVTGDTLPLPYTTTVVDKGKSAGTSDQIVIGLTIDSVKIETESDRTGFVGLVVVNYLKPAA